jgi:recombination protein RecA
MNKLDGQQALLAELYINQRLHVNEVAAALKVGKNTVVRALQKYQIKKSDRFPEVFTTEQKSVLYGSLLGDANLCIQPNGINACLRMEHSIKQTEWLKYKFNIFKPWINNEHPSFSLNKKSTSTGKSTPSIKFTTVATPLFTQVYYEFYKNNVKMLTQNILQEIDDLALATWFCDDGSYSHNDASRFNKMRLATCGFSQNENKIIIDYFSSQWNIKCSIEKVYGSRNGEKTNYIRLQFNAEGARKLVEIIRPHVIPSMQYKLDPYFRYPVNEG